VASTRRAAPISHARARNGAIHRLCLRSRPLRSRGGRCLLSSPPHRYGASAAPSDLQSLSDLLASEPALMPRGCEA